MIPIEKYKKLLGNIAETLTDEEILQIRLEQYRFAEIALDMWIDENLSKKDEGC